MIEKTGTVLTEKVRPRFGRLTDAQMDELGRRLAFLLGLRDA